MTDPNFYLVMASAGLAGLAMLVFATLTGWRGWLSLKQQQLAIDHDMRTPAAPSATARIEIADLKERIRKLEAIAAGSTCEAARANRRGMPDLSDIRDEYDFLDGDDRYRLLIELGRALEPMPEPLKTDATLVRGCSASVWVYPTVADDRSLHFLADSNAAITKGIIALVLAAVQDRAPADILATDIAGELAGFDLKNQLSSNRTQGFRT